MTMVVCKKPLTIFKEVPEDNFLKSNYNIICPFTNFAPYQWLCFNAKMNLIDFVAMHG